MRAKTLRRYSQTITQFIAFVLRAVVASNRGPKINLAPPILDAGRSLIQALVSDELTRAGAIHRLVMAILLRVRPCGDSYTCPVARFIIYMNVLPSGKIRHPGEINGTLTELKWPFRASTFWEVLQQVHPEMDGDELEQCVLSKSLLSIFMPLSLVLSKMSERLSGKTSSPRFLM